METFSPAVIFFVALVLFKSSAANQLKYINRRERYKDIANECEFEGGRVLLRREPLFNELAMSPEIPVSQEFWVGDFLYSDWIIPIDCLPRSSFRNASLNYKTTNSLSECYTHCMHYTFFAITTNYCVCLDNFNPVDTRPSQCNQACSDIGMCGGSNGQTDYASIYEIYKDNLDLPIESPNQIGWNYTECVAARCYTNEYKGVNCFTTNEKFGLCETDPSVAAVNTRARSSYVEAVKMCAQDHSSYLSGQCYNVTRDMVWLGHLRFTFAPQGGMIPGLMIATALKCTKNPVYPYMVTCIPTQENTQLPFVCKKAEQYSTTTPNNGPPPQTDPNGMTEAPKPDKDSNTTGIVVGCVFGVVVVCVMIAVVIFIRKRNNNNTSKGSIPRQDPSKNKQEHAKSVYEITRSSSQRTDHVYAETTDVYHPYIDIRDTDSSYKGSGGSQQNLLYDVDSQSQNITGQQPVSSNDIDISLGRLQVSNGYLEPKISPNVGRKLPDIPAGHI